jgi:hypothetical protein
MNNVIYKSNLTFSKVFSQGFKCLATPLRNFVIFLPIFATWPSEFEYIYFWLTEQNELLTHVYLSIICQLYVNYMSIN